MYGASWPINEEISSTRPYDPSREVLPVTGHAETERGCHGRVRTGDDIVLVKEFEEWSNGF